MLSAYILCYFETPRYLDSLFYSLLDCLILLTPVGY